MSFIDKGGLKGYETANFRSNKFRRCQMTSNFLIEAKFMDIKVKAKNILSYSSLSKCTMVQFEMSFIDKGG